MAAAEEEVGVVGVSEWLCCVELRMLMLITFYAGVALGRVLESSPCVLLWMLAERS